MKITEEMNKMDDINVVMVCPECNGDMEVVITKEYSESLFCYAGLQLIKIKEYTDAYNYFSLGADLGDEVCLCNLAIMHLKGDGCEKDYNKASCFLKKASKRGSVEAAYLLELMYSKGDSSCRGHKNNLELIMKAASKGNEEANAFLEDIGMRRILK